MVLEVVNHEANATQITKMRQINFFYILAIFKRQCY